MHERSRRLLLLLTAGIGLSGPLAGQQTRQIPLDVARGEIDRRYVPAPDTFHLLVRAASELMELRGRYWTDSRPPVTLDPWPRLAGSRSRDATLRVSGLTPGTRYQFEFVLVRRPTGNEGRLIENAVREALQDAFRDRPSDSTIDIARAVASRVRDAAAAIVPGAAARAGSPFSGDAAALDSALRARDLDAVQRGYARQAGVVEQLRTEYLAARSALRENEALRRALAAIAARRRQAARYAELDAPLQECRTVQDAAPMAGELDPRSDLDQRDLLGALKILDARIGACRGLLRDVRLPQYRSLRPDGIDALASVLDPVSDRLEALRAGVEQQLSLWGRREGLVRQVASDLRRSLDAGVTTADTVRTVLTADPGGEFPPALALGIGAGAVWSPCTLTTSCVRIVPQVNVGVRLAGLLNAEFGFTLADTDAPGRTRHLFWFTSAAVGISVRPGRTAKQRIGAGVLIQRKADPDGLDAFRAGGYVSLTLLELRL